VSEQALKSPDGHQSVLHTFVNKSQVKCNLQFMMDMIIPFFKEGNSTFPIPQEVQNGRANQLSTLAGLRIKVSCILVVCYCIIPCTCGASVIPIADGAGKLSDSERPWKIAKAQKKRKKQQEEATEKAAKETESTNQANVST